MPTLLRFALDQNFPALVLQAQNLFPDVELATLHQIDRRVSNLNDRQLLIYLHQNGWHGLVTNNYKMLSVPMEIAAIMKAKITVLAVEGVGHDPLRATGAVLLHLPAVIKRVRVDKAQVFHLNPRALTPADPWQYLESVAEKRKVNPHALLDEVRVTDTELATPVLGAS